MRLKLIHTHIVDFVSEHLQTKLEFHYQVDYLQVFVHQPSCGDISVQYIYIVGTFLFFIIFFSSHAQKEQKHKTNNFHPFRSFYVRFVSRFWLVTCFFFVRTKHFCKKKIPWLKTVLITSFTLLLNLSYYKQKLFNHNVNYHNFFKFLYKL